MSPKELLYIEDTLGHLKFMESKCNEVSNSLQDAELKKYATELAQKHKELFDKIYGLLNQ